jgi:hypothetical protein
MRPVVRLTEFVLIAPRLSAERGLVLKRPIRLSARVLQTGAMRRDPVCGGLCGALPG